MAKQARQENQIKEINSRAFESGFFNGTEALQMGTFNCKKALDRLKAEGYTVGRTDGNDFILGWKYALQTERK